VYGVILHHNNMNTCSVGGLIVRMDPAGSIGYSMVDGKEKLKLKLKLKLN
jgi:hypothetical protein